MNPMHCPRARSLVFALGLGLAVAGSASASVIGLAGYTFDPIQGEPAIAAALQSPRVAGPALYIVQFNGPVEESWKAKLTAGGTTIEGYLPENAFLVRMDRAQSQAAARLPEVRWVGLYHTAYRISPEIGNVTFIDPARANDPLHTLNVMVAENLFTTAAAAGALGSVLEVANDPSLPMFVIHIDPARIAELAALTEVMWIEEAPENFVQNSTTKWVIQSNVSNQTPVWNQDIFGEGQILAAMDSGLDYNSCWFRDTGAAPPGPSHRKVIDYKTWGGVAYDGCDVGHGTHVVGTAVGDQSFINPGSFTFNGMAYKAKVAFQDIGIDNTSTCSSGSVNAPGSLTNAFTDAYDLGARVHTNSWGSSLHFYNGHCANVDNFMWSHPDFLICYSNGNNGPGGGTVGTPTSAKNCVSVGATEQANRQHIVASYSSRGPTNDGRIKPTVMAPGGAGNTSIISANNDPGNPPAETCLSQGNPYFQGTSMATPAVAGSALLVRDYFAQGFYPLGAAGGDALLPSAALVKAMLVNSGQDMGTLDQPNNNEGWGRILLNDTFFFDGDDRELRVEDETLGLATGEQAVFHYEVDADFEPLEITLVWTDYPATTGANPAIVNNLNLTVQSPGGAIYRGNVYSGGESTTGGSADNLNVEECVRRATPELGTWTITIDAANVPQGGHQPFALVAAGGFGNWPASTAVGDGEIKTALQLFPAQPNPSSGISTLRFRLANAGVARLNVFDAAGRRVARIADAAMSAGDHSFVWDGRASNGAPAANGVYFYRLEAGGSAITRKLILAH